MYLGKTIEELHALLVSKTVTPLELAKEAIEDAVNNYRKKQEKMKKENK